MKQKLSNESGLSLIHWMVTFLFLTAFGVLAVDMNNLYLSRSKLQSVADAGALEGARLLYNPDGSINVGQFGASAIDSATAAAQANANKGIPVEVVSVNRGHWEFMATFVGASGVERGGLFTANGATTPADLTDDDGNYRTFQQLNQDPNEINAVEVVTARRLSPIHAFFSSMLGMSESQMQARSVAYVGFSGTILPGEIDIPIAICQHGIKAVNDQHNCSSGRFTSSSENVKQTAGWTDFGQPVECSDGASANSVSEVFCCGSKLNPKMNLIEEMNVTTEQVESLFTAIYNCWLKQADTDGDGEPDTPWTVTMPMIECHETGPGPCNKLIGTITMDIIWILNSADANKIDEEAPRVMGQWSSDDPDGRDRWNSFVDAYSIKASAGSELAYWADSPEDNGYRSETIYLSPSCNSNVQVGGTGGGNFGIRPKIPVLVN
jgi:hypothetical protein